MTGSLSPTTLDVSALLFDMDGTLVDSAAAVERTWRSFAERHRLDFEQVLAFSRGRRAEQTVARFAPAGVDVDAEARRVIMDEVLDTDGITPVPGAAELLGSLPEGRWALVTSAGRTLARARMNAAGLPVPQVLISADEVRNDKPSPEGYLAAANLLGVRPEHTVAFEDAEVGVLAARASGAATIVVGACAAPATRSLDRVVDLQCVHVEPSAADRLLVSY
jgi:HAD superfamily hydrolase (TIGR01509 family)